MKKYVFVKTGEEIPVGSIIGKVISNKAGEIVSYLKVTKETIPYLLEEGVIKEVSSEVSGKEADGTHLDIEFYMQHLADRINWKVENLEKYLVTLSDVNETAVFQTLLREIAIVLDQKYPDHIENSKDLFVFSTINGEIVKYPLEVRSRIKSFRNFAAFRTIEDALCAKHILKPIITSLFSKGGKQKG